MQTPFSFGLASNNAGGREFESRRFRHITANITGELEALESPVFVPAAARAFYGHHGEVDRIKWY